MKFKLAHGRHVMPDLQELERVRAENKDAPPDRHRSPELRTFHQGDIIEAEGELAAFMSRDTVKFTQLLEDGSNPHPGVDVGALQAENARLKALLKEMEDRNAPEEQPTSQLDE